MRVFCEVSLGNEGNVNAFVDKNRFKFMDMVFDSISVKLERVRRKRPELWENDSWILHQDNAPAHSALSVKRFLAKNRTPVLQHPPYSPDLAPCDFWLFPKLKSALKGTHFESVEAVKTKATEVLKALQEKDFQHCFNQWKIRMERCVKHGGEYIEGEKC
ncbi:hypothetical protein QTP88_001890 [Uroleucon formosanum]